jgi:hypothetical protein
MVTLAPILQFSFFARLSGRATAADWLGKVAKLVRLVSLLNNNCNGCEGIVNLEPRYKGQVLIRA